MQRSAPSLSGASFGETLRKCLADSFSRERLQRVLPLLAALTALKLVVSALVLKGGFSAISDDDFARVVIAQGFAHAPKVDPSGTSWLPLPFFVTGLPMMVLGRSFAVARGVAIASGVLSIWLVYAAARLLGASPRASIVGALIASIFPYSAWLGVATVPELPTAALVLFGAACMAAASPRARFEEAGPVLCLLGGAALSAAAACRYEAWPVACGAAVLALRDARSTGQRSRLLGAAAALFFPLAWLAHGQYHYADPFFFIKRVAEYKAALGETPPSLLSLIFGYPLAIVRSEPELCAATLAALTLGGTRLLWARPTFLLGLQLLVLIVGDVRGGAPTHHAERAVLAVWLFASILLGATLCDIAHALSSSDAPQRRRRARVQLAVVVVAAALGPALARPFWTRVGEFAPRHDELALGKAARSLVQPGETIAVGTEDYGYFALLAGFAEPERCQVFDSHDPREKHAAEAKSGPDALLAFAERRGARFMMLPATWADELGASGSPSHARWQVVQRNGAFVLLRASAPSAAGGLQVGNLPRTAGAVAP